MIPAEPIDPEALPGATWSLRLFCLCPLVPGACECPKEFALWE